MARPTGWDILGLDGDPTPGVVESVQALAKEFGAFAHDVEAAYRSLNSFGSDTAALEWVDAGWFQLASENGLFGADCEFLVAVKQPDQWWWAHVRLAESWDVMGRGAAGVLGNGEGYPGFVMMSLDSEVVIRGDVWQAEIGAVSLKPTTA